MKFHWFAEWYHTQLPQDIWDKEQSCWVTPDPYAVDSGVIGEEFRMYLRLLEQADALGFDGVLVNEHHQTWVAMSPSPNLLASILAANTRDAAIVICGNSLALYNPPTRVAEEYAVLDCLSDGRLIAGFVFGTPMDTSHTGGMPPSEVRDRFHEARDLITRAWEEPEPFAFNGKYTKLRHVNVWPKPIQRPRPPIWVPGSGSIETWETVVKEDYCYGYLSFAGMDSAKPIVDGFWEYCDSVGGNMNPNRFAFTQVICCADTDAEAEKLYAEGVKYFYRNQRIPMDLAAPPGYNSPESIRAGLDRPSVVSPEKKLAASRGELSFWEYDELGYIIAGTPERVEQRVREVGETLRVGQLIPCMHMGNLSEETAAMNNELFGTQVIPKLRDVWGEYEDKWVPEVSQQRVAAKAAALAGQTA